MAKTNEIKISELHVHSLEGEPSCVRNRSHISQKEHAKNKGNKLSPIDFWKDRKFQKYARRPSNSTLSRTKVHIGDYTIYITYRTTELVNMAGLDRRLDFERFMDGVEGYPLSIPHLCALADAKSPKTIAGSSIRKYARIYWLLGKLDLRLIGRTQVIYNWKKVEPDGP